MTVTENLLKAGNARPWDHADPCSAALLRSPQQISSLSQKAGSLLSGQTGTLNPDLFLASVDENAWAPLVVIIARGSSLVGVVYAKERRFAGIPSGIVYADATLGAMMVALPGEQQNVLMAALRALINHPGIRGLRVVVPATGFERETIQRMVELRSLDVQFANVNNHSFLVLPQSYEEFLGGLGSKTRRNFRYYRRQFEKLENMYIQQVPPQDFPAIATELEKKCVPMAGRKGIDRDLRMLSIITNPIMVGLRDKSGEWLSVLGGWYEFDRAVVFLQLNNDRDYPHSALCTVMRGYLIEELIARKVSTLLFWGGAVGTLRPYCRCVPAVCAHLDSRTMMWRTVRGLIAWSVDFLPEHLRRSASWAASKVSHEHRETV